MSEFGIWLGDAPDDDVMLQRRIHEVRGFGCSHCGYFNHRDSNVRDAADNQQHCSNCGEMFEVKE